MGGIGLPETKEEAEFLLCVADLLQSPAVRSMERLPQHGDVSCLEHSVCVAYVSYWMCKKLGLSYREAARGGLLHDLFLYDWHKDPHKGPHGFTHPRTALQNAERLFPLTDCERDIIVKHMWPLTLRPPRYRESFVVSCADKFCAAAEGLRFYHLLKFSRWAARAAAV